MASRELVAKARRAKRMLHALIAREHLGPRHRVCVTNVD
jgi:hypothetical protein